MEKEDAESDCRHFKRSQSHAAALCELLKWLCHLCDLLKWLCHLCDLSSLTLLMLSAPLRSNYYHHNKSVKLSVLRVLRVSIIKVQSLEASPTTVTLGSVTY